ncbi:hypothetical protein GGR56DRAFT_670668 [Xylariaceae sp. FL0804]|nr:hypothetical protein GGR56DRAFT_670668 [Xylariaceae sp. FL0804]
MTIFSYESHLIHWNEWERLNIYSLYYFRSSTEWVRISAAITTSLDSPYWELEGGPRANNEAEIPPNTVFSLPNTVLSQLERLLSRSPNQGHDAHLAVYMGSHRQGEDSSIRVRYTKPRFDAEAYLRERCSSAHVDQIFYQLSILHRLKGSPGFHHFLGIVVNDKTGALCGFLSEVPAKGWLFLIMARAIRTGVPVSLSRRLRWCRQIVEALSVLHDQGFVSGSLADFWRTGLAIDGRDRVVFFDTLRPHLSHIPDSNVRGLPPELQQQSGGDGAPPSALLPPEGGDSSLPATPATDVVDVGIWLWQLAQHLNHLRWSSESVALAVKQAEPAAGAGAGAGTSSLPGQQQQQGGQEGLCSPSSTPSDKVQVLDDIQDDPYRLREAMLSDFDGPPYMRRAIEACLEPDPASRLLAREILELFPSEEALGDDASEAGKEGGGGGGDSRPPGPRLEDLLEKYGHMAWCDLCGAPASDRSYHCSSGTRRRIVA